MKRMNRILAMFLIAVFAFSQMPIAALAAEEASGHGTVTSDTHDTGAGGGESKPDMGAVVVAFDITTLSESGEGGGEGEEGGEGDEGGASREVATWDGFKGAIANSNIGVITVTGNLDAPDDSDPITIDRTIHISSDDEYTVDLKNTSIVVEDGGNLTLDGALVLQGVGDQVIEVQSAGVANINDVKIESVDNDFTCVSVLEGGTVNIDGGTISGAIGVYVEDGTVTIGGGTISGAIGVYVEDGTVTIGGEAEITSVSNKGTGVYVQDGIVTIKDDVEINANMEGVGVYGGNVNIEGGTITAAEIGVYIKGGETTINGGTIVSIGTGVSVEGGTVTISGESEITATGTGVWVKDGTVNIEGGTITATGNYKTGIIVESGTVNIGGKAEISVTGEGSEGISVGAGGTVNIGGEAKVLVPGKNSTGIIVHAGRERSKGVSVLNISGGTISATGTGVSVEGGTATISGGTIEVTGEESFGVWVEVGTVIISGGTIEVTGEESFGVYVEDGEVNISGGTIKASANNGVGVGVSVSGGEVTISGGTIEVTGKESCGVSVSGGEVTISGGAITTTGEESYGVLAIGGDVNLISSAGLVINGGIYNAVIKDEELVIFELLQSLPAPISVSAGQRTAEFTLAAGEDVTFEIDNESTSVELETEIDADNKVTLTLPGATGTYNLVLSVYLKDTPTQFKLTVPITVKPRSGGGTSTPTIPAAGGAAKVSYTASGGTLFLQMPSTKVNEIIEKSGGSEAEFDLSRAGSATAARLPGNALSSFAQAGLDVTLRLPAGTMTLSSAAAASVATQATDENVRIELQQATGTLTDAQKAAVGSGDLVLDINIYSGTQKISNFDGTLAMAVPYDGPLPVAVWYLNDAGELERLNCTFENGMVQFTLHHLSLYVVGQDTEWKNPFADLKESSWYYDAVAFIAQKGITAGTTATTFSPDATLTRGQFITMLLRAYEIAPDDGAADNFADAGDSYYTGYLAAAKRLGIANGVGDNQFAPEQAITRQEMFTLLYNALGVLDRLPTGDIGKTLPDFADSDAIADWAREALAVLVECGIVSGSGGRLEPTATTTRAQMAQVMHNLLGE